MRCVAKTRTGRRCKRRTCVRGDYCYQHLASVKGLEVKKSSLTAAGLGLWAVRAFKKGENIIEYTGEKMSKKQFDKLRPESDYGFLLNKELVLDARRTTAGVGRYSNDCRLQNKKKKQCQGANSRFVVDSKQKTVQIRATRNIRAGEEVFVPYGKAYWKQ
jgi:SET domain-containing protein